MKWFLFLFLVSSFISCSDDNSYSEDIVGIWYYSNTFPKEIVTNNDKLTKVIRENNERVIADEEQTMTFTKDGKVMNSGGEVYGYQLYKDSLLIQIGNIPLMSQISISGQRMVIFRDYTSNYDNEELIADIIGKEASKNAVVSKVIIGEAYIRK